jgi:predicted acylesterase/phospholipase RssA
MARLFPAGDADPPIHFYFTRSNVERGVLEFATNWAGLANLTRPKLRTPNPDDREPVVPPDLYEVIRGDDLDQALRLTERAVFASMDLPPLFPYVSIKLDMTEFFEDGGVVDNLPVWFGAQVEKCDLLFVLPLNASFSEPVDHSSVVKRVFRVMDVRQGVLERNALKLSYLYNELAALRQRVEDLGGDSTAARISAAAMVAQTEGRPQRVSAEGTAISRHHRPISLFTICPAPPLGIGTTEFWKRREAGAAFELMYAATKYELAENFEADTDPNWIKMTLVSPQGERSYTDEF